jgi:hypothetical protein
MPNISEIFIGKDGVYTIEYDDGTVSRELPIMVNLSTGEISSASAIQSITAAVASGGQTFKTINGESIIGTGDIVISGGTPGGAGETIVDGGTF